MVKWKSIKHVHRSKQYNGGSDIKLISQESFSGHSTLEAVKQVNSDNDCQTWVGTAKANERSTTALQPSVCCVHRN